MGEDGFWVNERGEVIYIELIIIEMIGFDCVSSNNAFYCVLK